MVWDRLFNIKQSSDMQIKLHYIVQIDYLQDQPKAMTVEEVTEKLGLRSIEKHTWHIQETSAIVGRGLHEGLD
jgi:hypothetical protein